MTDTVPQRAAGAALIAAGGIYFAAEFIAAAAWTDPPYSYAHDLISDLGARGPLTWVMNAGFGLFGPAALTGVLLSRGLPGRRRALLAATAALMAGGGILVALFPASGDGTSGYHGLGAFLAFVGGNVLVIGLGRAYPPVVSRRLGRTLAGLGILGLVALGGFGAVLASGGGTLAGLVERGVNYPYLIGFMLAGAALWQGPGRAGSQVQHDVAGRA